MAGPWDHFWKQLVEVCPNEYVAWVEKDATFVRERNSELHIKHRYTDALLEVSLKGRRALLHLEFQVMKDTKMSDRMLQYNVMASLQHKLPVYSYVIYVHREKKGRVATSPYIRYFVDGKEILHFHFGVIKMWEISAQQLLAQRSEALLPLLPLTQGGKELRLVQSMIEQLAHREKADLLASSYLLGSLVFTEPQEREWFFGRFFVHQDILRKTWAYQMISEQLRDEALKEGLEQGLEQGREQGREQGVQRGLKQGLEQGVQRGLEQGIQQVLQEMRQGIQEVVQVRFPEIAALVKEQLETVQNASTLLKINLKVSTAQSEQEMCEFLAELSQVGVEPVQQK